MPEFYLMLTCEHGGNRVPERYRSLFHGREELLASHRGWDPGALELARDLSAVFRAPLHASTVTRLLVDLNRSPGRLTLFSEVTRGLERAEKERILEQYYHPFRRTVEAEARRVVEAGEHLLHLSLHSFTPQLRGVVRRAEVGLLYDPRHPAEKTFCRRLRDRLLYRQPELTVRFNYPYRGAADGHTTALRRLFPERYLGIEVEVNQRFPLGERERWDNFRRDFCPALGELITAPVP